MPSCLAQGKLQFNQQLPNMNRCSPLHKAVRCHCVITVQQRIIH
jgi:hypothetical protein